MFSQLTLQDLQTLTPYGKVASTGVPSTPPDGTFSVGAVAEIFDPTYGVLKAVFARMCAAQATALPMAPAYLVPITDDNSGPWSVSQTYNSPSGVLVSFVTGFIMATAAANPTGSLYTASVEGSWRAGDFGWVQVAGLNPYMIWTNESIAAGSEMLGTAVDGVIGPQAVSFWLSASGTEQFRGGYICGVAEKADSGSWLWAGNAMIRTAWATLPRTV